METIRYAIQLVRPNCFLASIDLKDAYFSVPIAQEHRKFLRFQWQNKLYEFTCLPFGLACAPRVFTKVMKPLVASLRSLGFIVNEKKSIFVPTQQITFLGFALNSVDMTISVPPYKVEHVILKIREILGRRFPKIRDVASVIGLLVSCELALPYGPLFRRTLENEKNEALAQNDGNFEAIMSISTQATSDLHWWIENLPLSAAPMHRHAPDFTLETDASSQGWGAHLSGITAGGRWSQIEATHHINILELKASFLALQSLFADKHDVTILLKSDSATAVAYLQHFGGSKSKLLNSLTREIWLWCMRRRIWLLATHLPGTLNTVADYASRNFHEDLEWKLNPAVFRKVATMLGEPDIDLFASRLNFQITPYVTWRAEPGAVHTDAFTLNWASYACFYAFPPFCLIGRILTKVEHDQAFGILIAPLWHTQPWFPRMLKLLVKHPCVLPFQSDLLSLPFSDRPHPLRSHLKLIACLLSGKPSDNREFLDKLPNSSWRPGEQPPGSLTGRHSASGFCSVLRQKLILFSQL